MERRVDELTDSWHADFIRLTLESNSTSETVLNDAAYLQHVKAIVSYIGTKGAYVLVSLWIDPTFTSQGWPTSQTAAVWRALAREFYSDDYVLYGLVNEPEANDDGSQDAEVWQRMNDTVQAIRDVEAELGGRNHIVAVQGTRDWARVLDYYIDHPITAGGGRNIAYETHPYDSASMFDARFGIPSQSLPVIIGEFGPDTIGNPEVPMNEEDARLLMDRAEQLQIPYAAWNFHVQCDPNLLVDTGQDWCSATTFTPSTWGNILKERLSRSPAR